jgi:hypothetical protein
VAGVLTFRHKPRLVGIGTPVGAHVCGGRRHRVSPGRIGRERPTSSTGGSDRAARDRVRLGSCPGRYPPQKTGTPEDYGSRNSGPTTDASYTRRTRRQGSPDGATHHPRAGLHGRRSRPSPAVSRTNDRPDRPAT